MTTKSIVGDAVKSVFALSSEQAEQIAIAAEMATDARYDFNKACDAVAQVFRVLKDQNLLTFAAWEAVRTKFEGVAEVRARDNGAIDPKGAGSDCWNGVTKKIRDIHGLAKPKSENADSERKRAEREAERAKALESVQGKSATELKSEVRALYGEASDESIAKAKSLEKALKLVESAEADAIKTQIKPMVESAQAKHKQILELLKSDPKRMGDYVVLLAKTYDIWVEQLKA